jgi:hypothetical protein
MNLSGRGPMGQKPAKPVRGTPEAREHIRRVKSLGCVVPGCGALPPSHAHHCIHDRHSSRKVSDFETIPLCDAHHQNGPLAIHRAPATWRAAFGPDHGFLRLVAKLLEARPRNERRR